VVGLPILVELPFDVLFTLPKDAWNFAGETLGDLLSGAKAAMSDGAEFLGEIRMIPEVQVATDIAELTAASTAVIAVTALAAGGTLLPLLQYAMFSPALFFARRKRQAWGVVYHAALSLPVDLATVRLFKLPEHRLVATRVTDKQGRYFFLAEPGTYCLECMKSGFTFPSQILSGVKQHGKYLDVYHGETIQVTERGAAITANIPLDPVQPTEASIKVARSRLKREEILRGVQQLLPFVGLLLAFAVLILHPSVLTATGAGVQISVYLLTRRLVRPRRPLNWGIVYDQQTKNPIRQAIVRVFEPKYNKLLETVATDDRGRYSLLVGPSQYFTTYEKEEYQTAEIRPIDTTKKEEAQEIVYDVGLIKNRDAS
jgi:hypothetical protein